MPFPGRFAQPLLPGSFRIDPGPPLRVPLDAPEGNPGLVGGPAESDRDPERQGVAVLVRVDRITQLNGTVVQQRE
jgi:hypothetical protein